MDGVIVAVSSGSGWGERALIRLSGVGVRDALRDVLTPMPGAGGACALASLCGVPVLVLRFDGPRSFTGQDTIELLVPGGPAIVDRVMRVLTGLVGPGGRVRDAEPGEFSARAFLNGRLSLDGAEAIAATIAARTRDELAAADRLLSGVAGARYRLFSERSARLLALVEAGIDFTDQEDVVPIGPGALAQELSDLRAQIAAEIGSAGGREWLERQPRVVLAGAPNAGKSTLFNALLGRARAVVSPIVGTTRDVLVEPLDCSREAGCACVVMLVDAAGLDDDTREKESSDAAGLIDQAAQARARRAIAEAPIVLHCDPSGRFAALDLPISDGARIIRVRTKADLAGAIQTGERLPDEQNADTAAAGLAVCALDGWHVAMLRRAIADAAWSLSGGGLAGVAPRHARTLALALDRFDAAWRLADAQRDSARLEGAELIAGELRAGLDLLGELTGAVSPDDIIGRIFATFCVGK